MIDTFIAIDVETANFEPTSICAIGAVKVVDGEIVDKRYSLVCPEPNYYSRRCTEVHGLTDDDTHDAPSFGDIWKSWQDWFGENLFIAHNASFDSRCIRAACRAYCLDEPDNWACTLIESRRKISKELLPSKSLDALCDFFDITLENHHNALDDAIACAKLAIILGDYGR